MKKKSLIIFLLIIFSSLIFAYYRYSNLPSVKIKNSQLEADCSVT